MELYQNLWLLDSDWYDSPPSEDILMSNQQNSFAIYHRTNASGGVGTGYITTLKFFTNGTIGINYEQAPQPTARYLFLFYSKPDNISDGFEAWFMSHAKLILLNNTKWKFHDTMHISNGNRYDISFYNNNTLYTQFYVSSGNLSYVNDITTNTVYQNATSWINSDAQIIQFPTILDLNFTSSNSTTFTIFYSWLIENADMIDPAYIVNSSELTQLANLLRCQFNTSSELSYPKDFYYAAMVPTWKGGKF